MAAELTEGSRRPRLLGIIGHHPPRIANERGTALEFIVNLQRVALTVAHLEEGRDYIASATGARRTRIIRLTPGTARLVLEWEKRAARGAVAVTKGIGDTILPRVELDQDVWLELETSLLVVGKSGTGKSNLTWFMLNELNAIRLPYRLYVIDPKKVELAELVDSPNTIVYSDTVVTIDDVINRFYDDMMATFEKLKAAHMRRAPLGPEYPLNIMIIDEIILCPQAREGVESKLFQILSSGRAAGYIVLADSQLGQIDVLSRLRDLFPQRVCMKTTSIEMTNAVLGPKCEERGARCTEITEPGVGYIFTDFAGAFMRFKVPFIEGVSLVASGAVWRPSKTKRINPLRRRGPCYTYQLYNRFGILLYVGMAKNPNDRIGQHKEDKPWYVDIDHGRTLIKKYPSEDAAREAEQEMIENLHPKYNIIHNHKQVS
jgi:hypothetical protein